METLKVYLDNMFMNLPQEPKVLRAKDELLAMMTEKYEELRAEGKNDHEALGMVIMEFGSMEELADALGVEPIRHKSTETPPPPSDEELQELDEELRELDSELDGLEAEFVEAEKEETTSEESGGFDSASFEEDMRRFGAEFGKEMAGLGAEMSGLAGSIASAVRGAFSQFGKEAEESGTRESTAQAGTDHTWAEVRELEPFTSLELFAKIADISLESGDSYTISLTEKLRPKVEVRDGVLYVREETEHAWFSGGGAGSVFFGFGKAGRIRVTVPQEASLEQCDMTLKAGNVSVSGVDVRNCNIKASAGNVKVSEVHAESFLVKCSAGGIRAEALQAEQLTLDSSAGSLKLTDVTGNETKLSSSAGSVKCVSCSLGNLEARSSAGNVRLEDTKATSYRLNSSVGSIKLSLPGTEADYSYQLQSKQGDVRVGGEKHGKSYRTEEAEGKIRVDAGSSIGGVRVSFMA
ncbi:MAG: DUF4097 family beta strand repeat protein [Lachnospiraceae bacterium]|nr:DUF4097 family beta strand repeat protein [Lachnospiraceae bacterium]